jgi:hypothetical protein
MRTRDSLTAMIGVLSILLAGAIIALVARAGPDATADVTGQVPATAGPVVAAPDPGGAVNRGGKGGGTRGGKGGGTASQSTAPKPIHPTTKPTPKPTHTTSPTPKPIPPRLGNASAPKGAAYSVSGDRQGFTMAYSTLEAGTGPYPLGRSLSMTVPVTGDTRNAVLELSVSGYAFAESTTAKLSITANRRTITRSFRAGADDEFVQTLSVPLRGARQCTITLNLEVRPSFLVSEPTGYLTVSALYGQLI